MEVCKNAASSNSKPPLSLEDAQKIVSNLNRIWDMTVTFIREHESPLNNQGRNDPCLNPDAGTSSCNNQEKKQEEMNSEGNPIEMTAENASNVCNISTINTDNSRDNLKRKEINFGTLKTKRCHHKKGIGVKKSRKLSDTNNTGEVHVNTVIFVAENDGVKSECIQSLKRKGSTDNVTSKKKRPAEAVAQKIVNDYVSSKENSNSDENGGGFGFDIDRKISEEVDLTDETQAMSSDNLYKTEENKSSDIIEISDDEDDTKKSKNKGTTVKVCDAKNKKTSSDINDDTLDRLRIFNDITIKPARSMAKNLSISMKQSISSLASSTSPLSTTMSEKSSSPGASKPVQSSTSNLSGQEPIGSLSHVTTPLNLPIPKDTEILVASRSSTPSLISHTSTSKPSPQVSKLSPQQPPILRTTTTGTIIPYKSYSMNLLPSSRRSKIPVFSSPSPIPVADKHVPTVNPSALPKLARRPSQLLTSTLARCDSPVVMQPSTAFTTQRHFAAPSHFNTPLNLPLFGPELSVTSTSSLQKSSSQSHAASFRRELTRSNSPAQGSIYPYQTPKTWHTPVTLISETTSHTTNTFVQGSSPAASRSEASTQMSIAPAHSVILSNPELSITSTSPIQKPGIPPKSVQASSPAPAIPINSFDSVTDFGERSTPPSSPLKKPQGTRPAYHHHHHHHPHPPPSSVQRAAPMPISRKSRSNFPATPAMLYMPIRPPLPTIPTHPEIAQQVRPNILPGATLDVSIRGTPSLYDPNVATNQAIHNIVTEYCYNSLVMSLPCLPNETIRGLMSATFKKDS